MNKFHSFLFCDGNNVATKKVRANDVFVAFPHLSLSLPFKVRIICRLLLHSFPVASFSIFRLQLQPTITVLNGNVARMHSVQVKQLNASKVELANNKSFNQKYRISTPDTNRGHPWALRTSTGTDYISLIKPQ
jgi:hypothetical protein